VSSGATVTPKYCEVVERVPQFLSRNRDETAQGRATYAEAEESEQRCREPLAAFETAARAAYNADVENSGVANSRLRIVKDPPWPVIRGLKC
jgi:hypothetical protein